MSDFGGVVVAVLLGTLFVYIPTWLVARAVAEGWYSGMYAVMAKAKKKGII